jgi:hypothetical protein
MVIERDLPDPAIASNDESTKLPTEFDFNQLEDVVVEIEGSIRTKCE